VNELAPAAITELEELAAELRNPSDVDTEVHTTRKGIKRLRAFLRLARRPIGRNTYRTENAALRDAARLIAPARDALVLIETAAAVGAPHAVLEVLAAGHQEAITELERGVRIDAADRLRSAALRWRHVAWDGPDAASVRVGLAETYRRGLADLASVQSDPTDTAFHGWRRRVKYIRYQLETIGVAPGFTKPFTLLGDDLGLEHDNTVLISVCRERATDAAFLAVEEAAAELRAALRTSALVMGNHLFTPDPAAYLETVEGAVDPA
jgi:CHAD domain-containing protein